MNYFENERSNLTNFHHLSLFRVSKIPYAFPFFLRHGHQLPSLHFDVPNVELDRLLDECPNLEDLVISFRFLVLRAMGFISFSHPKVRQIGLRDVMDAFSGLTQPHALAPALDEVANWVSISKRFPNLSCIRLLDVSSRKFNTAMDNEELKEVWEGFIFWLEEEGVDLEDQKGQKIYA